MDMIGLARLEEDARDFGVEKLVTWVSPNAQHARRRASGVESEARQRHELVNEWIMSCVYRQPTLVNRRRSLIMMLCSFHGKFF